MAKFSFEDYANGAMAIVGLVVFGNSVFQAYKQELKDKQRKEANDYIDKASSRLGAMHSYAIKNRISKAEYRVLMAAARNRIQFDAREALPGNPYVFEAIQHLTTYIDKQVANNT